MATFLTAIGMNTDYIEYMMGNKIDTYHNVKTKGVESLSIRPKTAVSEIDMVEEFARRLALTRGYPLTTGPSQTS
mgnify:CR=1 FL=1